MENSNDEALSTHWRNSHPKVHSKMCNELTLMLDMVSSILPSIEAAQPGCKAGVEELCNLYNIVDKGKLIIQNCIECSSLYLAITSEATAMRCERIRNALRRSLFLIQNMVEPLLADEVADVHNDLRDLKFIVDPAEEDAGKVILEMLRQSEVTQELELQTFQVAASKLNITSPKAILVERRAIKKLLAKINGTDPKKEGILKYLLYLVRKYGKNTKPETCETNQTVNAATEITSPDLTVNGNNTPKRCISTTESGNMIYDDQNNLLGVATPPPEFCCPLSMKIMRDPVIIASGQTYERENIERWFIEGYDTCPRTQMKLQNFTITPNTCMKAVIYNWCKDHELEYTYLPEQFQSYCSVSSLHNVSVPLITKNRDYMVDYSSSCFGLSGASYSSPERETEQSMASFDQFYSNANYQLYLSFNNFDKAMFLGFFHELSEFPLELQSKAVRDLKIVLCGENQIWHSMVRNGFLEASHEFLKNGKHTLQARRAGTQFFLAFLASGRARISSISEDMVLQIASLLYSEFKQEVLQIVHELLQEPSCQKSDLMASVVASMVFRALDSGDIKCQDLALKMICKISSYNDIKPYLISSGIISKLAPLISEGRLTECSLKILRNLSELKETREFIISTDNFLSSISDHLDTGSHSEREYAAVILLAVCSHSSEVCSLAMKEGVIPALVDLSVSATEVARNCSIKLLQLLKDFRRCDQFSSSCSREVAENPPNDSICKQPISKSARYISRKLNIFSKPRSLTLA